MINPLAPWVTVQEAANHTYPRWTVKSVGYRDDKTEPATDMSANIYIKVQDEAGNPLGGVRVAQSWPPYSPEETAFKTTDRDGKVDFFQSGDSSFDPQKGQVGPYRIYVLLKDYPTPEVRGLGLPLKRHVNYDIVFQLQNAPDVLPETTLEDAVLQKVQSVEWMPVNNTGTLWKYAKAHNLQDQQTDELTFIYNGIEYLCQVFNLGIVYAQQGDWNNIKVIPK